MRVCVYMSICEYMSAYVQLSVCVCMGVTLTHMGKHICQLTFGITGILQKIYKKILETNFQYEMQLLQENQRNNLCYYYEK